MGVYFVQDFLLATLLTGFSVAVRNDVTLLEELVGIVVTTPASL